MLKKIGKKLIKNFSLKILAVLFASALWIIVVNIDDPMKTRSYTTSVTLINTNYITEQDKYYESLDTSNTVTFQVSAKRSVLEQLSSSDFSATADMEKIERDEKSDTYRVPIVITNSKNNSLTITTKKLYMELALEDLGRAQKTITADTKGTVADGCALGDIGVVGSNLLKISGPYSIVSQVDAVKAVVNVEGMSSDVTDNVVPVLYDAQGNTIDTTKLTLSISTVTVAAQILNTKDVNIELKTPEQIADGYVLTDMTYQPNTVRIKGESVVLNPINKISIPSNVLDFSDATGNVETTIDISAYLPSGTSLVLNSDAIITVKANIEPIVKKSFEVPVTNISITNLGNTLHASFGVDFMTVEIAGADSAVKALKDTGIKGSVDAAGLGAGNHMLTVRIDLDENVYQTTSVVEVPLLITDQVTVPETEPVDNEATEEPGQEETSSEASGEEATETMAGASDTESAEKKDTEAEETSSSESKDTGEKTSTEKPSSEKESD